MADRSALELALELAGIDDATKLLGERVKFLQEERERLTKRAMVAEQRLQKASAKPRTHLVIGDAHADPLHPNDRFTWLGRMCAELKPEVIVDIGDFASMESLCSYEKKGSKALEGRRYEEDCQASWDARERINKEIRRVRGYKPELHHIEGNHEYRITKAFTQDVILEGKFHAKDLGVEDLGWIRTPFMVPRFVDGICYQHYQTRTNSGTAISGIYAARHLIMNKHMSCVVGHSHGYRHHEETRPDGTKVLGLVAGCYFLHEMPYATTSNQDWWRGIVVIHDVQNGYGHVEQFPIDKVRERWGS